MARKKKTKKEIIRKKINDNITEVEGVGFVASKKAYNGRMSTIFKTLSEAKEWVQNDF